MNLIHTIDNEFAISVFSKIDSILNGYKPDFANLNAISAFFEPSTRTSISFELASGNMKYINLVHGNCSNLKGEGVLDSCINLASMNPDFLIIRAKEDIFEDLFPYVSKTTHIINAGCSSISHPSQALADCYLISKLNNPKVVICGDIECSRVAKSNVKLLTALGINVTSFAYNPVDWCKNHNSFSDFIHDVDVLMCLRAQTERHSVNLKSYSNKFRITQEILNNAKPSMKLMHPGPVNRNIEISEELIYSERSYILDQVKTCVIARKAIFDILANT